MVLEGDGATGALALANGEVLVEGLRALDRRGVAADDLVDIVDATVGRDSALVSASRAWVVRAVRLNDVVLYQR